jgi:MoaA/NifB/PqqE/SkfB family radical SAM enzyme
MNKPNLAHLYISPLERCNLNCQMCYTQKPKGYLTNEMILDFINRYSERVELKSITFCGGEVFLLAKFTELVNQLTPKYYLQIITNGTINKLDEIESPNSVNLIVSLDGLPEYHEQNRGNNTWVKSVNFLHKAIDLGFHTEIFSIVTKENIFEIPKFEKYLETEFNQKMIMTYHPRKTLNYLNQHPKALPLNKLPGFNFISPLEMQQLSQIKNVFPPRTLGCHQISLMADGIVYACCEGIHPLGKIDEAIERIIDRYKDRLKNCLVDCVEPDFTCGLEREYVT